MPRPILMNLEVKLNPILLGQVVIPSGSIPYQASNTLAAGALSIIVINNQSQALLPGVNPLNLRIPISAINLDQGRCDNISYFLQFRPSQAKTYQPQLLCMIEY